jgi:hypothetical protein
LRSSALVRRSRSNPSRRDQETDVLAEIESAWLERFGRAGFDVDVRGMLEAGLRER